MKPYLLVGLGGAAGSMLRFGLQRWLNGIGFPTGTLCVNLIGCALIGLLWGLATRDSLPESGRHLLMSGFCGGFTTLSAFALESGQLLQGGRTGVFLLYAGATIVGGLLATFAAYKMVC